MKSTLFFLLLVFSSCSTPHSNLSSLRQVDVNPQQRAQQYQATGKKWMISTQGQGSTKAGAWVLDQGGNLFDAALAVSFAISVERPQSTGIGGGGFLLFREAGSADVKALDFRERAPLKIKAENYLNEKKEPVSEKSLTGSLAAGTPGLVSGLLEIHRKKGKLPLSVILKPAIDLAENGFPVYPALMKAMESERERLLKFPASRKIFLDPEGKAWPLGHHLEQKDLAETLRRIAREGESGFYRGPVAQKMVKEIQSRGGVLSLRDLKDYKPLWRKPVQSHFREYEVFSMPPPSSGGVHVLQILNLLEDTELDQKGPQDPEVIHRVASAMSLAFRDRARFMGDPDFVSVPVKDLISKEYAQKLRPQITELHSSYEAEEPKTSTESHETTHFTLMDQEGNMISSTQTINGWFGSALVIPDTGVLMNNEMDDFALQVGASNLFGAIGGKNNLIEPLKRPLSSMSPTLVFKNSKPFLALGTPSGTRIITCVAQTLLNRLKFNQSLWESVTLTRYHHQWRPDVLRIEDPGFPVATEEALIKKGHRLEHKTLDCKIQAIENTGDSLIGVSDPREEGLSLGR